MEEKALKPTLEKVFDARVYPWKENKDRNWLFFENKRDKGNVIPMPKYQSRLLAALHYAELGFSVIPMKAEIISADEIKKIPLVKWKPYQTTRATPGEIREWWTQFPNALIGVICGKVSGIIAFDTDTLEADQEFQSLIPEGLEVPTCSTPRGESTIFLNTSLESKISLVILKSRARDLSLSCHRQNSWTEGAMNG